MVGIGGNEGLDVLAVDAGEHERGTDRRIKGACFGDPARLALSADVTEVSLAMGCAALRHVLDVLVEQEMMGHASYRSAGALGLAAMSNLDRRGGYTPRRTREQRAYRLIQVGGAAGVIGVVSLVFAIVGVIGLTLPVIALIVAAVCFFSFRRATGQR